MKPKIFIASSVEGLPIAKAVQQSLRYTAECTVWDQDVFIPSHYPMEALGQQLQENDFGIFVFSPDDTVTIRQEEKRAVRDNVLFELGLFMGALGRHRTFILKPQWEELRIASDLLGLTCPTYEDRRSDGNWTAAVGGACTAIGSAISKLGKFDRSPKSPGSPISVSSLSEEAVELLLAAADSEHGIQRTESNVGTGIFVGDRRFIEEGNARSQAKWKGALNDLHQRRFVETDQNRYLYEVTDAGFKEADRLKAKSKPV